MTIDEAALKAAFNAHGWADAAAAITPPPAAPTKPNPPTNLKAAVTPAGAVTLTWTPAPGADGYDTYRDGVKVAWALGQGPWTDPTPITKATQYQMAGYNAAGPGALSSPVTATLPAPTPPVPVPPATTQTGLGGIFPWDHERTTFDMLRGRLALPAPTVAQPLLAIMHLRRDAGWAETEGVWFAGIWGGAGAQYRKCITVPAWPDGVAGSWAAAANGDYNAHYYNICRNLAATFPGEEIWLRFAHEANCCYNHKAVSNPNGYKAGWGQFAPIARAAIPKVQLVFCPIFGDADIAVEAIEPDPKFFDRYGFDYYVTNQWQSDLTRSHGLNWLGERGKLLGKPVGLFEFGPGTWIGQYAGQSCPDAAQVIINLYNWKTKYNADVAWYIDNTASAADPTGVNSDITQRPVMLDAMRRTFGTATPHVAPAPV